jgi:hypothetical protein
MSDKQEMHIHTAPVNPIAEAINGYMRDRSALLARKLNMNMQWRDYPRASKEMDLQITDIDRKIKVLLAVGRPHLMNDLPDSIVREVREYP